MQEAPSKIEEKQPSEPSEPNVSESELPNLEEVTPKMSNVNLDDDASLEVPLPAATSDEEEFHEASESVSTQSKPFLFNNRENSIHPIQRRVAKSHRGNRPGTPRRSPGRKRRDRCSCFVGIP